MRSKGGTPDGKLEENGGILVGADVLPPSLRSVPSAARVRPQQPHRRLQRRVLQRVAFAGLKPSVVGSTRKGGQAAWAVLARLCVVVCLHLRRRPQVLSPTQKRKTTKNQLRLRRRLQVLSLTQRRMQQRKGQPTKSFCPGPALHPARRGASTAPRCRSRIRKSFGEPWVESCMQSHAAENRRRMRVPPRPPRPPEYRSVARVENPRLPPFPALCGLPRTAPTRAAAWIPVLPVHRTRPAHSAAGGSARAVPRTRGVRAGSARGRSQATG